MSIEEYNHNHILPISKYPFFDFGKQILKEQNLSISDIDDIPVYNEIIAGAINDILDSFQHNRICGEDRMRDNKYEVIKFYLTLFILKSMPSRLMYSYWIKTYITRFESFIKNITNLNTISTIFNELKMPHKFLKLDGLTIMAIKMNDYLDFAIEVKQNDNRFGHLLLVNMPVYRGRVFIPIEDLNDYKLIIIKLVEKKIYELLEELDLQVRSKKIDRAIAELQGYLIKDPNSKTKLESKLDYGQTTPEIQINNEKIMEMFKAKPGEIQISQFCPCINKILNKLLKKEILKHPENIMLASYLSAKGFIKEQMTDVFLIASNADSKKISYNLDYVLDKQLKPYNCQKSLVYNLCYKEEDRTGQCGYITNPLGYEKR